MEDLQFGTSVQNPTESPRENLVVRRIINEEITSRTVISINPTQGVTAIVLKEYAKRVFTVIHGQNVSWQWDFTEQETSLWNYHFAEALQNGFPGSEQHIHAVKAGIEKILMIKSREFIMLELLLQILEKSTHPITGWMLSLKEDGHGWDVALERNGVTIKVDLTLNRDNKFYQENRKNTMILFEGYDPHMRHNPRKNYMFRLFESVLGKNDTRGGKVAGTGCNLQNQDELREHIRKFVEQNGFPDIRIKYQGQEYPNLDPIFHAEELKNQASIQVAQKNSDERKNARISVAFQNRIKDGNGDNDYGLGSRQASRSTHFERRQRKFWYGTHEGPQGNPYGKNRRDQRDKINAYVHQGRPNREF